MSLTIDQFVNSVPPFIRVGQWWVINYGGRGANTNTLLTERLFQLDGQQAIDMISQLMVEYQWDTLPPLRNFP